MTSEEAAQLIEKAKPITETLVREYAATQELWAWVAVGVGCIFLLAAIIAGLVALFQRAEGGFEAGFSAGIFAIGFTAIAVCCAFGAYHNFIKAKYAYYHCLQALMR